MTATLPGVLRSSRGRYRVVATSRTRAARGPVELDEERLADQVRPWRHRPVDDGPVEGLGRVRVAGRCEGAGEVDARMGREPGRPGGFGGGDRTPLELLGVTHVPACKRVCAEAGQGERGMVREASARGEIERPPVGARGAGAIVSTLGDPASSSSPRASKGRTRPLRRAGRSRLPGPGRCRRLPRARRRRPPRGRSTRRPSRPPPPRTACVPRRSAPRRARRRPS